MTPTWEDVVAMIRDAREKLDLAERWAEELSKAPEPRGTP